MAEGGGDASDSNTYYLELNPDFTRFEPVSTVTSLYFDDCNLQVFAVRSGGVTGVVVKGPGDRFNHAFRIEDRGPLISIKFSPDQTILAVQRTKNSVELCNYRNGEIDNIQYSQSCKSRNATLLGFVWTAPREILFATDHGVELYQVFPDKKQFKLLKSHSLTGHWMLYSQPLQLLLICSGSTGNIMQTFLTKPQNVPRHVKFEIDMPSTVLKSKLNILERDVTLANIYGNTCIAILRHQPRGGASMGAEIHIFIIKDNAAKKTNVLKLHMSGRFAVSVIDNLFFVHHQASKTSMVFDCNLPGESDGYMNYQHPVCTARSIRPFKLRLQVNPIMPIQGLHEQQQINIELYSLNWVMFQPDIVVDAKLGCLWTFKMNLQAFSHCIQERLKLLDFLLARKGAKSLILQVLKEYVLKERCDLIELYKMFDRLNEVYKAYLNTAIQSQMALPASGGYLPAVSMNSNVKPSLDNSVIIDQSDLYTHVLSEIHNQNEHEEEEGQLQSSRVPVRLQSVILEYIRSLVHWDIPVQYFLYEMLINTLIKAPEVQLFPLHQLLQYFVVSDSKPLACLLLSLENLYPAASQLSLDMLKRLGTANDEIVEILLSKHQVLSALRFLNQCGSSDLVNPRKFLEAALESDDKAVFYATFRFFQQRNLRIHGTLKFSKGDHCELYVQKYKEWFGRQRDSSPSSQSP